jgi:organic radical activating enzyme
MRKVELFKAWGRILSGRYPSLSIEITRECPLRCPGCYAYEPEHLAGTGQTLRTVADYKGDELVEKVLDLVRRHKPVHISIVGGEPLVRYRELGVLLPKLSKMGIAVQVVTSAVREIPPEWNEIDNLYLSGFHRRACSLNTMSAEACNLRPDLAAYCGSSSHGSLYGDFANDQARGLS